MTEAIDFWEREMYGTNLETRESEFFFVRDILYVDMFSPKSNYRIPRFHTKTASYQATLTMEEVKYGLTFLTKLDTGTMVNMHNVETVEDLKWRLMVSFKECNKRIEVAYSRKPILKHLIEPKK
ncbi:LytTR family transcriptional regulator DNA-binding domain-containing protein [Paenibacillus nuruki]|uniref:LytTR family transcriptional regulator DNA-binding domain-containing protein n=1 Tax=Paenibacillus nuruki TaxID=1886670 RepID=UPI002803A8D5|nr:LytTR family transcriptional regulator DNA-binding domain-containing protein [Paenibacillus nuruki]CAJ1315881.1 hypothetical protein AASFL403_11710 [Paenibacillus nuruki]